MIPTEEEIRIGSISSDVDRYTAISVPMVIILPEYRLEAAAENPHWGMIPNNAPQMGPDFFAAPILALPASPALCSISSINKYVIYKNGSSLILSIAVSLITSINISLSPFPFPVFIKFANLMHLQIICIFRTSAIIASSVGMSRDFCSHKIVQKKQG